MSLQVGRPVFLLLAQGGKLGELQDAGLQLDEVTGILIFLWEVGKKVVSEEGKNKGLEKNDAGDNDTPGPAGASIHCFLHLLVA